MHLIKLLSKPIICIVISLYAFNLKAQPFLKKAESHIIEDFKKGKTSFKLLSYHQNKITGVHHHYFIQHIDGVEIYESFVGVHISAEGNLIKKDKPLYTNYRLIKNRTINPYNEVLVNVSKKLTENFRKLEVGKQRSTFLKEMRTPPNTKSPDKLDPENRSLAFAQELMSLRFEDISKLGIPKKLIYYPTANKEFRTAYELYVDDKESCMLTIIVDAQEQEIIAVRNHVHFENEENKPDIVFQRKREESISPPEIKIQESMASAYRVYELPIGTPYDGNRTLAINPEKLSASPLGWHTTNPSITSPEFTTTKGNNVDAFKIISGNEYRPNGGASLQFDFPLDTTYSQGNPSTDASITNAFYIANRTHDILYAHGFDESAGNMQKNNFSNGGLGNDAVRISVQEISGECNASMSFPADGIAPNMSIFTCYDHDVALDGNVVLHEYAHGVTGRLIGGPLVTNCIQPRAGGNEGWSDLFGLILTIKPGDQGNQIRIHSNWYRNNTVMRLGNRKYSTAPIPGTFGNEQYLLFSELQDGYQSIHSVGQVWCAMFWDLTWALINQYGFNPNIDQPWNTGGNNLALQLAIDALKLLPCNANFIDNRNAVLAADMALTGGVNQCIIWQAFATRGLGVGATQTYINDVLTATNDFTIPQVYQLKKSVVQNEASVGQSIQYTLELVNNAVCNGTLLNVVVKDTLDPKLAYTPGSASHGGVINGNVITWNLAQINVGASVLLSYSTTLQGNSPNNILRLEDFEDGSNGVQLNEWAVMSGSAVSGNNVMFANNPAFISSKSLQLKNFVPNNNTVLSFWHKFDTDTGWDGGRVQISLNNGQLWTDLGPHFILNKYNYEVFDVILGKHVPGFSGLDFIYKESKIDLSAFAGNAVSIRFLMTSDDVGYRIGWFIDLITIYNDGIFNQATAMLNGQAYTVRSNKVHTSILNPCFGKKVLTSANSGAGSLRTITNCASPNDTITFASHIDSIYIREQIILDKNLTIFGSHSVKVNGSLSETDRLFTISNGAHIKFNNIQFLNGGGTTFSGNGGAVFQTGALTHSSFTKCSFINNKASLGGVFYIDGGNINVVNSVFNSNSSSSNGSVIALSGPNPNVRFDQSLFYLNQAVGNSMISNSGSTLHLSSSTISQNSQTHTIRNSGNLFVHNNIFKNTSGSVLSAQGGVATISYNLLDNPGDVVVNQNSNFVGNPLFINELMHDYKLTNLSPAINSGRNSLLNNDICDIDDDQNFSEPLPIDLEGNNRFYSCELDLGVYEYQQDDAPIVVRNSDDNGSGSLRNTIACAPPGSTILFDSQINGDSIFLTSGVLSINKNLNLKGNGTNLTLISGSMNGSSRIFYVDNAQVKFEGLALCNGGGSSFSGNGGGIAAINNSEIKINKIKLHRNRSSQIGGALYLDNSSQLKGYNVDLSFNSGSQGSAIFNQGDLDLNQAIIVNNICLNDPLASTIRNEGIAKIKQSTIAANSNNFALLHNSGSGNIIIDNTILESSTGIILSNSGSFSPSKNLIDKDSDLGDFLSFSGYIHAKVNFKATGLHPFSLGFGSGAIAGGSIQKIPLDFFDEDMDANDTESIPFDFKGFPRLGPCGVSIGAYEYDETTYSFLVTNPSDGVEVGSLRDIIACAPSGSTIDLNGSYNLSLGEINLNKDLIFKGQGLFTGVYGGQDIGQDSRIFDISNLAKISFENVNLTFGGGNNFIGQGSALNIQSGSDVVFLKGKIADHTTTNGVIAVAAGANFSGVNTIISNNNGTESIIEGTGNVLLVQSLLYENTVNSIFSGSTLKMSFPCKLQIHQSTLADNSAASATIINFGTTKITNSIFDNNVELEYLSVGTLVSNYNLVASEFKAGRLLNRGIGSRVGNPSFDRNNGFQEAKYRLKSNSDAINFGGFQEIPKDSFDIDGDMDFLELISFDLSNNPRIALCNMIDAGPFEHQIANINWVVRNPIDGEQNSLRSLIGCASDGDTIKFDKLTNYSPQFLSLGEILLDKELIIAGNGEDITQIHGLFNSSNQDRLFDVNTSGAIVFKDIRISGGGGNNYQGKGAGFLIRNGSAIFYNSSFSNHSNNDSGGVFYVLNGGFLNFLNCRFYDNYSNEGAILWNEGNTTFEQCVFHDNTGSLSGIVTHGPSSILSIHQSTSHRNNVFGDYISIKDNGLFFSKNSIYSKNAQKELNVESGLYIGTRNLIDTSRNVGNFLGNPSDFFGIPSFNLNPYPYFGLQALSIGEGMGELSDLPSDILDLDKDNNTFEKIPFDFAGNPRVYGCNQVDIGAYEGTSGPTGVMVTSINNAGTGTLRDIIPCAPSGSIVRFWKLRNGSFINLTTGPINIDKDLTLEGNGVQNTIIDVSNNTIPTAIIVNQNVNLNIANIRLKKQ